MSFPDSPSIIPNQGQTSPITPSNQEEIGQNPAGSSVSKESTRTESPLSELTSKMENVGNDVLNQGKTEPTPIDNTISPTREDSTSTKAGDVFMNVISPENAETAASTPDGLSEQVNEISERINRLRDDVEEAGKFDPDLQKKFDEMKSEIEEKMKSGEFEECIQQYTSMEEMLKSAIIIDPNNVTLSDLHHVTTLSDTQEKVQTTAKKAAEWLEKHRDDFGAHAIYESSAQEKILEQGKLKSAVEVLHDGETVNLEMGVAGARSNYGLPKLDENEIQALKDLNANIFHLSYKDKIKLKPRLNRRFLKKEEGKINKFKILNNRTPNESELKEIKEKVFIEFVREEFGEDLHLRYDHQIKEDSKLNERLLLREEEMIDNFKYAEGRTPNESEWKDLKETVFFQFVKAEFGEEGGDDLINPDLFEGSRVNVFNFNQKVMEIAEKRGIPNALVIHAYELSLPENERIDTKIQEEYDKAIEIFGTSQITAINEGFLGLRKGIYAEGTLSPNIRMAKNKIFWSYGDVVILKGKISDVQEMQMSSEILLRSPFANNGKLYHLDLLEDPDILILGPKKTLGDILKEFPDRDYPTVYIEDLTEEQMKFFNVPEKLRPKS